MPPWLAEVIEVFREDQRTEADVAEMRKHVNSATGWRIPFVGGPCMLLGDVGAKEVGMREVLSVLVMLLSTGAAAWADAPETE